MQPGPSAASDLNARNCTPSSSPRQPPKSSLCPSDTPGEASAVPSAWNALPVGHPDLPPSSLQVSACTRPLRGVVPGQGNPHTFPRPPRPPRLVLPLSLFRFITARLLARSWRARLLGCMFPASGKLAYGASMVRAPGAVPDASWIPHNPKARRDK